jgi:nitrous oxidase accessory protein NosD
MSYTLRGRIESRLAAASLPFFVACILALTLSAWWPVELAGAMVGIGLALDLLVYHRALPYQPGWAAVPLGATELALTIVAARVLGIEAPLGPALWFFVASWLVAQLLGHAGLPLLRLTYAEDGGELGQGGVALSAAAPAVLLAVTGVAWVSQPPTVRLAAGVHEGPITIDRSQRLIGEPGTIVRGGIVVRADDVTIRGLHVIAGASGNGIDADEADDLLIERVTVSGATLDGIHLRRSSAVVRDCTVLAGAAPYAQGIDISFSFDRDPTVIEDCTILGGLEGIVTHSTRVRIADNRVVGTRLRGITMTEMSMGGIEDNEVRGARGVGIFCGDYSHCEIEDNHVTGTTPDRESDDLARAGYAIQSHFYAEATVAGNLLEHNAQRLGAFANGRFVEG